MIGDETIKEIIALPIKSTKSVVQLIEQQPFNRLNSKIQNKTKLNRKENKIVVQLIEQ